MLCLLVLNAECSVIAIHVECSVMVIGVDCIVECSLMNIGIESAIQDDGPYCRSEMLCNDSLYQKWN